MTEPRFDPTNSVNFDLGRGRVEIHGEPQLLVSLDSLVELCQSAGTSVQHAFGRAAGGQIGARVAKGLPTFSKSKPETALEHLGGVWATAGLGSLELERWGQALVLVCESVLPKELETLLSALLQGALESASGRNLDIVPLGWDGNKARLLVANATGGRRVRAWISAGVPWGEALRKLQEGSQ